ncbi:cysteine and histidine-rich domain-containing protein [Trichogramma pretiosum]|uniref:cysteine and histidine-rich domain-containing protein n=1 Tax=Trichogramma pretiosum TaxID=7493 RepID=UPI0006C9DAB8|nr:cysteine and histidine-rich domain-containing protein [Trichogramma pretiosum]
MTSAEDKLLFCYNRGCGEKFDPSENNDESCRHHPGHPVFHDAYKSWSCCKKKCTDFTEFLNIVGCTRSKHSNVKPAAPVKPKQDDDELNKIIAEARLPSKKDEVVARPSIKSLMIDLKPKVSPKLLEQLEGLTTSKRSHENSTTVVVGQNCTNNCCKGTYLGPSSNEEVCVYHPGVPIFHEGLKYWSCCQKKTTDFNVFMEQKGCTEGSHVWTKQTYGKKVNCRLDWHQTATHVIISIFGKKYDPKFSSIKLNPVRLLVDLYFPEESSNYKLDLELQGVVVVEQSSVTMLPTKTEIELRKAGPGSWSRLEIPKKNIEGEEIHNTDDKEDLSNKVDAVDLSDL